MEKTKKMLEIEVKFDEDIEILLQRLYRDEKKTLAQIGEEFDVDKNTARWWMKKFNIPIRTLSEASKLRCQDDTYRQKLSKITSERNNSKWQKDEYRQKMSKMASERNKRWWKNDAYRQRMKILSGKSRQKRSELSKRLWKDDKYRQKMNKIMSSDEYLSACDRTRQEKE